MTQAYPLQWPAHIKRTALHLRKISAFSATPDQARQGLKAGAKRMGTHVVISTNVELRLDGEPYASRRQPEDTGVAVYFMRKGQSVCIACDKYERVWENMRGLAKTIEAMRGIERWGSSEILDQAFTGFIALPSPDAITTPVITWWGILGERLDANSADIQAAWKAKIRDATDTEKLEINLAHDEGLKIARGE